MQVRLLLGMSSVAIEMLLGMCHAHVTASCLPSQVVLQDDQHDKEIGSPKGAQEEDQDSLWPATCTAISSTL